MIRNSLPRAAALAWLLMLQGCILTRDEGSEPVSEREGGRNAPRTAIGKALALLSQETAPGIDALKASDQDLARAAESAGTVERDAIDSLRAYLGKLIGAGGVFEASATGAVNPGDQRQLDGTIEMLASLYVDDVEVQLASTTAAIRREPGDAAAKRAEALASRFPTEPRAQAILARALRATGGDPLAAMRAYAACLKMSPRHEGCRTGLVELSGDFGRRRCPSVAKARFAVHREVVGKPKTKLGKTKITGEELRYFLATELTGADVTEVAQAPDVSSAGLMPGDGKPRSFVVSLTPLGAARYAELTRELADWRGHIIVVVGDKVVAAPQVASSVESGQLAFEAKIELGAFCDTVQKRDLPAELEDAVNRALR